MPQHRRACCGGDRRDRRGDGPCSGGLDIADRTEELHRLRRNGSDRLTRRVRERQRHQRRRAHRPHCGGLRRGADGDVPVDGEHTRHLGRNEERCEKQRPHRHDRGYLSERGQRRNTVGRDRSRIGKPEQNQRLRRRQRREHSGHHCRDRGPQQHHLRTGASIHRTAGRECGFGGHVVGGHDAAPLTWMMCGGKTVGRQYRHGCATKSRNRDRTTTNHSSAPTQCGRAGSSFQRTRHLHICAYRNMLCSCYRTTPRRGTHDGTRTWPRDRAGIAGERIR